ncbi:unnamed protein product [Amoebophrya sp. A120]|nr:unnamed protein product [Amoebophrya sp. A120]|eukprot:GSA120T00019524001.1
MLAGRNSSSLEDFDFLIRQTETTLMQVLRANKREAYENTEESAQKAMAITMRAQKSAKLHGIFSGWYRQCMRGKLSERDHYWKLQVASLKTKTSLGLQRALGAISDKTSSAVLKFAFEAWKEERAKSFQERYRMLLYEVKHKGAAQMKRILTHMCGNNDLVFARTIFIGWKEFVQEQLTKRRENSWRSAVNEMKQHSRHALLQRTIAMFELQDDSLQRGYFQAWKDHYVEEKLTKHKTTWLQNNSELKERFRDQIKQRIYMQCYTQHSLLMKHVYTLWKDYALRTRIHRMEEALKTARFDTDDLGTKLAEQKLKANSAVKKSLVAMLGSQTELIRQSSFNGWQKVYVDQKFQKQADLAKKFQDSEKKWKQSMSGLLKNHDSLIGKHIFETWRRMTNENHCIRMRERMLEQKMKESKRFQHALISMFDSQQHLYFQQIFANWKELGMDRMMRKKEQAVYEQSKREYKMANMDRMNEVVSRMIGDRTGLMIQHVFKNWNRYALTQQATKWQRKYHEDTSRLKQKSLTAIKKSMLMMFDGKLELLVRQVFSSWQECAVEYRNKKKQEESKQKLRIQASERLKATMMNFLKSSEHVLQQTVFSAWKDRWVSRQLSKIDKIRSAYDDIKEKAVLNGCRACEVTVFWENNYIAKSYFTAWKDACVKESWRNSLAKWRDTFTALETKVRQEAQAKPTTVEQKLSCAEFEIKGLLDALLKTHGMTSKDFGDKETMKEWVDAQVGFKSQLIVPPGMKSRKDKENNAYYGMAVDHLSQVATQLGSPAKTNSTVFSTRSRKPMY